MNVRERHALGGGIVLLMAAISVLAFPRMPAEMITHWGPDGPDGSMDRTVTLIGLPALAVGILALFDVLPRIDPLGEHLRALDRYYDALVVVIVGLLAYVHALVVVWNLGYEFDVLQAIVPAVAIVFYVAGVVMDHVEKNWFVGVRTPWTLSSDEVWDRTHDRAGPMFKAVAVLAFGAILLPEYGFVFLVGPVAVTAIYLTVYSYLEYRRLEPQSEGSA